MGRDRGCLYSHNPCADVVVTYLFITLIVALPSDEVERIGLWRRPLRVNGKKKKKKPIKQFTNSPLFQSTKPSLFLSQVYFCTFYLQTPSLYLPRTLSLSLLETCLLHTWKPWHGKFTVVRVKRELNYILLVWTDYQNEQQKKKKTEKKFSTPNGALGYL